MRTRSAGPTKCTESSVSILREFAVTCKVREDAPSRRPATRQKAIREAVYGDEDRYSLDYRLIRPNGECFLHSQYEAVRDQEGGRFGWWGPPRT